MKKEIELSEKYLMVLKVSYVKNVSEGKREYEIKSKIVDKEEYKEKPDTFGELEGSYFVRIPVRNTKSSFLKKYYKQKLKNKINRNIDKFVMYSKKLVEEWEQHEEVIKETESHVEQYLKKNKKLPAV